MRTTRWFILCGLIAVGACARGKQEEPGSGPDQMAATPEMGAVGDAMGPTPVPDGKTEAPLDDATARSMTGQLLEGLSKKAYAPVVALFSDKVREAMGEAQVKQLWEDQLLVSLGAYKSHEVVKSETIKEHRRHQVRVTFEKGAVNLFVVWTPGRKVTGLFIRPDEPPPPPWEPPAYVKAEQVRELPVTVGEGELALPGILTVPAAQSGARLPAVVLVHGSGPQDKDETIGPNKPFKDLAWGLAARGIAVLRYDKVTLAHPDKAVKLLEKGFTVDHETTDDALRAVALLRGHALVDPALVFFLGHSQGGMVAPRAGARDPKLAGIIAMGGPTRPFEDLGLEQLTYIASLGGPQAEATRKILDGYREQLKLVKSPELSPATPAARLPFGIPATFWLDLRSYDVGRVTSTLEMPVLVLQGEADYQVTMADFEGWKKALAGKKNAILKSYPRLGHTFIDLGKDKAVPEDYLTVKGHVAQVVVEDIARFVQTVGK